MSSLDRVLSKPELRQSKPSRADFAAKERNPITVVLDGVSGNYNLGAIFRLCDAFMVERLVICAAESQGRPGTPLLRKRRFVEAAMGAQDLGSVAGGTRCGWVRTRSKGSGLLDHGG